MEVAKSSAKVVSITRAILTIAGMGVVVLGISVAGQAVRLFLKATADEPWDTTWVFVSICAGMFCAGLWLFSAGFRAFVRPTDRTVRAMAFIAAALLWTWMLSLAEPFIDTPDILTTARHRNVANLVGLIPATAVYLILVAVLCRNSNLPDQRTVKQRINAMRRYHMWIAFLLWISASDLWREFYWSQSSSFASDVLGIFGIPIACIVLYKVVTAFHKRRIRAECARLDVDAGEGGVVGPVEPSVAR